MDPKQSSRTLVKFSMYAIFIFILFFLILALTKTITWSRALPFMVMGVIFLGIVWLTLIRTIAKSTEEELAIQNDIVSGFKQGVYNKNGSSPEIKISKNIVIGNILFLIVFAAVGYVTKIDVLRITAFILFLGSILFQVIYHRKNNSSTQQRIYKGILYVAIVGTAFVFIEKTIVNNYNISEGWIIGSSILIPIFVIAAWFASRSNKKS